MKLSVGKEALPLTVSLIATFLLWLVALLLIFSALFSKFYRVDATVLRRHSADSAVDTLSIEAFYQTSAKRKYIALFLASMCFFGGVVCAVLNMAL